MNIEQSLKEALIAEKFELREIYPLMSCNCSCYEVTRKFQTNIGIGVIQEILETLDDNVYEEFDFTDNAEEGLNSIFPQIEILEKPYSHRLFSSEENENKISIDVIETDKLYIIISEW